MDLPVPEWAYQLVIGTLVTVITILWKKMNSTVADLVVKLDEARDNHSKAEARCTKIEAAHAKEYRELVDKLLGGADA
jgi:low affinity Fe/Cu permease